MGKPRRTKEEKALESKVEAIVKTCIHGAQIDIWDLSKISAEGMRAANEAFAKLEPPFVKDVNQLSVTDAIEDAVVAIVSKLRKN
jgi:hypothetical protein